MQQNINRQIDALEEIGLDKMFIDKVSGKNADRPELNVLLEFAREGDVLYFDSISRLARNTKDFLHLMETFQEKKVEVVCLKESIDTTTPQGKMISTIFAAMYEMDRENIRINQREGIKSALDRGVQFGRPKVEISEKFKELYPKWKLGEITAVEFMNTIEMKKNTFYRRVKEYEE